MKQLLSGVRVLDLSRFVAGPFGTMILGDLGAEIIKIEVPGGDETRMVPGPKLNGESFDFMSRNRNKKSVSLDLKTPLGKQAFIDLVRISDVVWDNYRVGAIERLGADYDSVKKINPRIISCSVTGYGPTGPYRDAPSYDSIIYGLSGLMSLTGHPGGPPVKPGPAFCDMIPSMYAVIGVLAALLERAQTGAGKRIEISMLDAAISMLAQYVPFYFMGGGIPRAMGSGHIASVPHGAYPTKDGYVVIGPCWPRIAKVLGAPELMDDPRFATRESRVTNRVVLDSLLSDLFRKANTADWVELLHVEDIGAAPLNNVEQALHDPQVVHDKIILNVQHVLGGEVKLAGSPIRIPGDTEKPDMSPPLVGQHTDDVLGGLLNYSGATIQKLKKEQQEHAEELDGHIHKVFSKLEQPQSESSGAPK